MIIFLLYILLPSLSFNPLPLQHFEVMVESVKCRISGQTNVNNFACNIDEQSFEEPLSIIVFKQDDHLYFEGFQLQLPLENFDCGLTILTHDFRDFLLAEKFPTINIEIVSFEILKNISLMEKVNVKARSYVTICGKPVAFSSVKSSIVNFSSEKMEFLTNNLVRFSDFELTPPTKFFGSVRVENTLEIELNIRLRVIEN